MRAFYIATHGKMRSLRVAVSNMAVVGLISCASRKRPDAAEARNLYISPLFTKSREYVVKNCEKWYILSAKYGLLEPDQVVDPYEETLNTKSRAEQKGWAEKVWIELEQRLFPNDEIIILAGKKYREFLTPRISNHGCQIQVPMEGLGIGRQLQWLTSHLSRSTKEYDLDRFYHAIAKLESAVGGKRLLSNCNGQQKWPRSGLYFFFEPGEFRSNGTESRIVRVGTHGISRGSKATLWNRLRTHRGSFDGSGNHRSSVFRLHVGAALAMNNPDLAVDSWVIGQSARSNIRNKEQLLEKAVSEKIGSMSILWLAVGDEASPASDRAYLERNIIGLLVAKVGALDLPSADWLGLYSPDERIRNSGLWNLDFLDYNYSREFLDIFEMYIQITINEKPIPTQSLAPPDWYANNRLGISSKQLSLLKE